MKYRLLGSTGIKVSEISLGAEWLEGKNYMEVKELISYCESHGINLLDCWMSEPNVRTNIGLAIKNTRNKWIIQGHIGSIWEDNQYVKTRDLDKVIKAFNDLLSRLQTDYLDFGMIHYVDDVDEFKTIMSGEFFSYVKSLKEKNIIHHIGLSTHNTDVAILATEFEEIELIMFSINPAYDMLSSMSIEETRASDSFNKDFEGINPTRSKFYQICQDKNIAITVMKGFAGGTLFNKDTSPFKTEFTPVQCISYALSKPCVSSILVGVRNVLEMEQCLEYETASSIDKDFATVLVNAPIHSYKGQCTYCGHCSPCSSKINIAMVNKYYDLAKSLPVIPKSVQSHYNDLKFNASDCTSCMECESRCPFDVEISKRMNIINEFFK